MSLTAQRARRARVQAIFVLSTLLIPLQARGEVAGVDDIQHLISVLDANRPTSAEGWTRDVGAVICPQVTDRLHAVLTLSDIPAAVTVTRREIEGETEIEISRWLSPLWNHALVIASPGASACTATIYSDAH